MSKLKSAVIFIAGVTCGAAVAWATTKQKYEQILEEEIESVKETYKNRQKLIVTETEQVEEETVVEEESVVQITEEDKKEYNSIIENNGYVNYTKYMNGEEKEKEEIIENDSADIPYVIDPEQFGEDGYDTQTLTYYADGVLVDDLDDLVEDPDTVVGAENLKVFEEFGATSVLVRNEVFKVDYEIVKDDWNYSDLNQDVPPKEELQEYFRNVEEQKAKKPHEL